MVIGVVGVVGVVDVAVEVTDVAVDDKVLPKHT